jgi:hypothetical protein
MLTRQQIIDTFITGLDETPSDELIETYQNLKFTQEQLDAVVHRNLAIQQDPTFVQRTIEDYQNYMTVSVEEQLAWTHIQPVQS